MVKRQHRPTSGTIRIGSSQQVPFISYQLMSVDLSETSPAEWKYISEGGATIVFSYQGPRHPILTGKVLRLGKAPRGVDGISNDNSKFAVESQQKIFSRLLNPSYLVDLQVIPLEAQWVEAFAIHHESSRPQERRAISMINCTRRTGILAPDLVGGLSCVVEIKVNSGDPLEELNDNSPNSRNGGSSRIRFTCHQRACPSRLGPAGLACIPI